MSDDLRERVARAMAKHHTLPWEDMPEARRERLLAYADATIADIGGLRVRELVWDDASDGSWAQSQTGAGWEYLARNMGDYWLMPFPWKPPERFPSLEAAKAAAQTDYEARILAAIEPAPSVREAARVLLDALNEASELDDVVQNAMQEEADTDGTDEWVFVLRAGLRAIAEGKE